MDLLELLWVWQPIFLHIIFDELVKATLLVLENPTAGIDEIMKVMPGPDFPTGGIICGYRGIKEAFIQDGERSSYVVLSILKRMRRIPTNNA